MKELFCIADDHLGETFDVFLTKNKIPQFEDIEVESRLSAVGIMPLRKEGISALHVLVQGMGRVALDADLRKRVEKRLLQLEISNWSQTIHQLDYMYQNANILYFSVYSCRKNIWMIDIILKNIPQDTWLQKLNHNLLKDTCAFLEWVLLVDVVFQSE